MYNIKLYKILKYLINIAKYLIELIMSGTNIKICGALPVHVFHSQTKNYKPLLFTLNQSN